MAADRQVTWLRRARGGRTSEVGINPWGMRELGSEGEANIGLGTVGISIRGRDGPEENGATVRQKKLDKRRAVLKAARETLNWG